MSLQTGNPCDSVICRSHALRSQGVQAENTCTRIFLHFRIHSLVFRNSLLSYRDYFQRPQKLLVEFLKVFLLMYKRCSSDTRIVKIFLINSCNFNKNLMNVIEVCFKIWSKERMCRTL